MEDYISHYGIKRRSGRYPWGSGEKPQRSLDILSKIDALKEDGLSEKERAASLGLSINQLRSQVAFANEERKQWMFNEIHGRADDGHTKKDIINDLGIAESTYRKYMKMEDPAAKIKESQLTGTRDILQKQVDEKTYLDVGPGSEMQLGVSRNKLNNVIKEMEASGEYYQHNIYVPQIAGERGKYTTLKVLTKEPERFEVIKNKADIQMPEGWTDDGGITFQNIKEPKNVSWDRVKIVYSEDGGTDRDGLMTLRRGIDDLDLGNSKYAQVRIAVNGTHYLKGMAMYSDDIPNGKDIVFYTNKPKSTPRDKVLKEMKPNKDNPFGATISRQRGALNIVNEEGDWREWSSIFSSQFLSKQPYNLIKEQIAKTMEKKVDGLKEVMSITNPTLRKTLLLDYADGLDGAAKSLKLQGFPKTGAHVILPFPDMKPNEVFAPNYNDGDKVVLVRHPHGGIFEIPELTVNNKSKSAKASLDKATDAIGIHPSVASKLSGADFDGDSVLVIPNNSGKIKTSKSLKELKNFDTLEYKVDRKTMSEKKKQTEMGIASNLITDMTAKGAPMSDIARAVKYSMVVIDAEKHNLDWKKAAIDTGVAALQRKYQSHVAKVDIDKYTGEMVEGKKHEWGASTLFSKANKKVDIYDPETKRRIGNVRMMDVVDDAFKLSSGTQKETAYAEYANTMKKMAIKARNDSANIKEHNIDPISKAKYKKQVDSLDVKLNTALSNAPKERQAQLLANKVYSEKLKEYEYSTDQKKKLRSQTLAAARKKVGANRKSVLIDITPEEWEAIQNNAISKTKMAAIFRNTNPDKLKQLATPHDALILSPATHGRILALASNGYTQAEIASALGISASAVNDTINPRKK